jgi:hypothetical protein
MKVNDGDDNYDEDDLRQELKNMRILFWAAVKSNGGKLKIDDDDIQRCTDDSELKRTNDSAKRCVIFEAC